MLTFRGTIGKGEKSIKFAFLKIEEMIKGQMEKSEAKLKAAKSLLKDGFVDKS